MKRAWPYALALAVVVTGCYLALAPLLRSLNPGPTGTAAAALKSSSTTTVPVLGKQPQVLVKSNDAGFTSIYKSTAKKSKKSKKPQTTPKVTQTPVSIQSQTTPSSSSNSSSTTTPSSSTTSTTRTSPSKPKTTKPAPSTGARAPISGTIKQSDNGGFAGQGNGDSTLPPAGNTHTVAGG